MEFLWFLAMVVNKNSHLLIRIMYFEYWVLKNDLNEIAIKRFDNLLFTFIFDLPGSTAVAKAINLVDVAFFCQGALITNEL